MTNFHNQKYTIYGHILVFHGIIPIFITVLFGLLPYRNVQKSHTSVNSITSSGIP